MRAQRTLESAIARARAAVESPALPTAEDLLVARLAELDAALVEAGDRRVSPWSVGPEYVSCDTVTAEGVRQGCTARRGGDG